MHLSYLRCVMEVPKSTPVAALYLELGILPVNYEIEIKVVDKSLT